MKNKKIGLALKVFLFAGIFSAAGSLYFFIARGNNPLDALGGASLGVLKNGSAIVLKSWGGVFGDGAAQQDAADEIDLGNESSTASFSISDADSYSGSDSDSDSAPASASAPQNFSSGGETGSSSLSSLLSSSDASLGSGSDENAVSDSSVSTTTKNKAKAQVALCTFGDSGDGDANAESAPRGIILNEIAWMGSLPQDGETGAKASEREWIELKNVSSDTVDISGWQVLDALGNVKIILSGGTSIPAGGFYLAARDDASLAGGVQTDAGYSGALPNGGDNLAVFDASCGVSDFLDAASAGWPGGNNTTKQTLERDADPAAGWHTSASPGGTPRAENSVPTPMPVAAAPSTSTSAPATTVPSEPSVSSTTTSLNYLISVSMIGAGIGTVSSSPAGILCGFTCQGSFAAGTKINVAETPADGSLFKGWSGACKGTGACSFTISSSTEVVAEFEPVEIAPPISTPTSTSSGDSASSSTTPSDTSSSLVLPSSVSHLVIAAIQIAGVSSSNDFVKIFNPTAAAIDISGWKLHKKSSTGTDYSLRTFPAGNSLAAGSYFVWANSLDGFSDSIGADASSTETLSADNSVALFDADGNTVDAVAWGTGVGQYVEGSAYPTDPTANQILTRKFSGGEIVDTDDNATDFGIQ